MQKVLGHLHGCSSIAWVVGVVELSCDAYLRCDRFSLRIFKPSVGRYNFEDFRALGVIGVNEFPKHFVVGGIDVGDGIEVVVPSANVPLDFGANFVDNA